jgi:hypothetical protein
MITNLLVEIGSSPALAKVTSIATILVLNFLGRRYLVFPLAARREWRERQQQEWKQMP